MLHESTSKAEMYLQYKRTREWKHLAIVAGAPLNVLVLNIGVFDQAA
jgi:hypothetical protein